MDRLTGPWTMAGLRSGKVGMPRNGLKVFSTFHCGGGSSMGYRLAGFDVVGGCEIDPQMMKLYRRNVCDSAMSFEMPIQKFKSLPEWPESIYGIDVLDGSPPCSTFSMSGNREQDWGKERKFREGQADQALDDLFFDFVDVAQRMRPKVVVAENVKGLILGNAKGYVAEIFDRLREAGYDTQLFVFNAACMGAPQRRERTFFIARRRDLGLPKFEAEFQEPMVPVSEAWADLPMKAEERLYMKADSKILKYWKRTMPGKSMAKAAGGSNFNNMKMAWSAPAVTVTSSAYFTHPFEARRLTSMEYVRLQTFPDDYDFMGQPTQYVCGMSVPPFMMMRVANQVAKILGSD